MRGLARLLCCAMPLVCLGASSVPSPIRIAPLSAATMLRLASVDIDSVGYYHMFTGPDGGTHIERLAWQPTPVGEFGSASAIKQFFTERAKSVVVFSAQPNFETPMHDVGNTRELDIVLSGTAVGTFTDGTTHDFKAGDVTLVEDRGSKGRKIKFGPDGYTGITIYLD